MEIQITLKGTPKEIRQQIDGLVAYYEGKEKLKNVIENEYRISKRRNTNNNLDPTFSKIIDDLLGF